MQAGKDETDDAGRWARHLEAHSLAQRVNATCFPISRFTTRQMWCSMSSAVTSKSLPCPVLFLHSSSCMTTLDPATLTNLEGAHENWITNQPPDLPSCPLWHARPCGTPHGTSGQVHLLVGLRCLSHLHLDAAACMLCRTAARAPIELRCRAFLARLVYGW